MGGESATGIINLLFKGGLGGENAFSVGLVCLLSVKIQVLVDLKQATLIWGS